MTETTVEAIPEMVERVARALCARHYAERFGKDSTDPHVQMNVDGNWHRFVADAGTAIAALREPTEAMIAAAMEETPSPYEIDTEDRGAYIAQLRSVIDAALR